MRAPRTLTARLVATMVLLVAVVSALVVLTTTLAMQNYLIDKRDTELTQALQRAVNPRPGPPGRGGGSDDDADGDGYFGQRSGTVLMRTSGSQRAGALITESGDVKAISTTVGDRLAAVPQDGTSHAVDLPFGDYRVRSGVSDEGDVLVVGLPTKDIRDTIGSLAFWATLLALAGVLLAAVAGWVLVRRQLRPLREVAATAHTVSEQPLASGDPDLSTRVDARHTDPTTEVGQVGAALNTLLDHVEVSLAARHRSEQQVRQFVADASHELRTPLSTIHGYAELSRRTPDDPGALSHALAKVETEADRMSALVEDLLLLARLDSGRPLEREEVDLTRLLLESVADARVVDPDHQWRLQLPEDPVTVQGDEQRLHQVVTNLLGNARHHTPPGTTVTVSGRATPDSVVVTVHDDGPGLPPELAATAFERFTRGDSSRTRASGGAGLGLSLVDAITAAHGGTAEVESSPGSTTFTLTLPR